MYILTYISAFFESHIFGYCFYYCQWYQALFFILILFSCFCFFFSGVNFFLNHFAHARRHRYIHTRTHSSRPSRSDAFSTREGLHVAPLSSCKYSAVQTLTFSFVQRSQAHTHTQTRVQFFCMWSSPWECATCCCRSAPVSITHVRTLNCSKKLRTNCEKPFPLCPHVALISESLVDQSNRCTKSGCILAVFRTWFVFSCWWMLDCSLKRCQDHPRSSISSMDEFLLEVETVLCANWKQTECFGPERFRKIVANWIQICAVGPANEQLGPILRFQLFQVLK